MNTSLGDSSRYDEILEVGLIIEWSATLPLQDWGRVAGNPFRTARIALHCATVQV